jgi:hypothetical protein
VLYGAVLNYVGKKSKKTSHEKEEEISHFDGLIVLICGLRASPVGWIRYPSWRLSDKGISSFEIKILNYF